MVKTYTLAVNVFNGGDLFVKTLASIEKVYAHFNEVYISITESEHSLIDHKNCQKFRIPNLRLNKQKSPGCKEHFINTIKNLKTDFVLFLGHDDICHEDGIIEAKHILENSDRSIAVYGSNMLSDNNYLKKQEIIQSKCGITSSDFILKRLNNEFYLNVSGIFNSVTSLKKTIPLMEMNNESYWLDMIAITTPYTKLIKQTYNPICTVIIHKNQMSNNVKNFQEYCKDGIWFHFMMIFFESSSIRFPYYFKEIERFGSYINIDVFNNYLLFLYYKLSFSRILFSRIYVRVFIFIFILLARNYISKIRMLKIIR